MNNGQELFESAEYAQWSQDYAAASTAQQIDDDNQHREETEMKFDDNTTFDQLVPSESKHLKKEDVGEGGLIVTIAGFTKETVGQGAEAEEKTVLHFQEDIKAMVLNRTNSQLIQAVTGAKTSGEARGKKIVVYNDPTISFGDRITGGIRVKGLESQAPAAAPAAPASASAPESDVPF